MNTKLKKSNGITLASLAIAIIVLSIIVGMTTYSLNQAMQSAKLSSFTSEFKLMKTQVDSLYEKMQNDEEITINDTVYKGKGDSGNNVLGIQDIGESIGGDLQGQADIAFNAANISREDRLKYKYYTKDLIQNSLGIEGIKQDFLVNVQDREILSFKGIEYKRKMYYNLNELPDAQYNVKHEESTAQIPDFEAIIQPIAYNEWKVTVQNIQYDGYIEKWQVKYKLEKSDNWRISDNTEFTITKPGSYVIKIANGDVQSEEQYFTITSPSPSLAYEQNEEDDQGEAVQNDYVEEPSQGPSIEDSSFEISNENSQSDIRD